MTNTDISEKILCLFTFLLAFMVYATESHAVINFDFLAENAQSFSLTDHKLVKRDATENETCVSEKKELETFLSSHKIDGEYTFGNESKYAMALAWAGENDGTLIIVTSQESFGPTVSTVYRSENYGLSYTKLDDIKSPIKKHNGLQRNPTDSKKVYLISERQELYVTNDGGENFTKISLSFVISDEIIFHPNKKFNSYLMARDSMKDLYVSLDNGHNWRNVASKTGKVFWGITYENETKNTCDTDGTIYVAVIKPVDSRSPFSAPVFTLKKSMDSGKSWSIILDWVASYERNGNFLYASVLADTWKDDSNRLLKISKDCGKSWNDAQLPTIEPDRFYSVMDIESNMIFMHVDDPLDSGHGTLYTSSTYGVVYSESLPRHLYPNYGEIHDFYKVKSIRGVYITSQMNTDDSIHTVISYNRGATWEKIKRPPGVPCKDETKECYLQIHGMYSLKRGINASLPLSQKTATGLIVAHGHVADALQKTDPDVYVSSDGGYNWRLALSGPHHYEIGDHGGLLVAISKEPEPKVIKFSTDEGRCWHEYTFTNDSLRLTGLLTEPEGKSLVVMIWGYLSTTRKWQVHVIDFKEVIKRKCSENDYEPWLAHQSNSDFINENTGCVLGMKETILRLRKNSFCYNDYNFKPQLNQEHCKCTREDYECDYGFYRPGGSDKCVEIPEFKSPDIDICLRGHEEKIVSEGYRKVPGDKCTDGFSPSQTKLIDLSKECDESSKAIVQEDEKESPVGKMSKGVKIFAIFLVLIVLALAAIMGVYFIRRYILLRRHRVEYRYSMLNQSEDDAVQGNRDWSDDLDNALTSSSVNYQDSDEELTTSTIQPSKGRRTQPPRQNGAVKNKDTNPFGSYHDDSDDDLLS